MRNDNRYCDYFNMSQKQFREYKEWKQFRIVIYILLMIAVTLFKARLVGYIALTIYLILTISHERKCEEQWIKDGVMKKEDLL